MESHNLRFALCLLPLAMQLHAAVPDGYVVKVDSSTVYLDWGKTSGVQAGDQFKIYREGEPLKHPVTGEILGKTEVNLGQGALSTIDEKFSTGQLIETKGDVKAGDRTHYVEPAAPAAATTPAAGAAAVSDTVVPKELWRSDSLPAETVGMALGDVGGDGKKDVVLAYRDHVEVFRWNGQKLDSAGVFKSRNYDNYLAVETADIDGAGHDKIFASLFNTSMHRARTVILDYSSGTLKEVGHIEGFVRAIEHADGKRVLLVQDMSMSREFHVRQPTPLNKVDKGYREGSPLKLARALNDDQMFGFVWGDWDGDGSEDLALLQSGERLRLFFKDAKWSSNEVYGGNKADFTWQNDQSGSIYPRLLTWKPATGKMQLLAPHNIAFLPVRMALLKIYKSSEIIDLSWNGLEMAPLWTLPISGELADFGIADVMQKSSPQLWTATVGAGNKTVLIAYQLP